MNTYKDLSPQHKKVYKVFTMIVILIALGVILKNSSFSTSITNIDTTLLQFESGEVVDGVYQNESLNIKYTPQYDMEILTQEQYSDLLPNYEYPEAYITNADSSRIAQFYTFSFTDENVAAQVSIDFIEETFSDYGYTSIDINQIESFEVGNCDLQVYFATLSNEQETAYLYIVVQPFAYGSFIAEFSADSDTEVAQNIIHAFEALV